MRAGDFAMDDFEVDAKFTKTALSPMRISTPKMKRRNPEKLFRSFSEVFVSIKTLPQLPIWLRSSLKTLLADMKGYDSVFDYLLAEQEVDRSMFDRQIDLIMSEFAPVAQKYLKHVAK